MVDIHAHILPGLDDGAESVEEALRMASIAAESGIYHMAAISETAGRMILENGVLAQAG